MPCIRRGAEGAYLFPAPARVLYPAIRGTACKAVPLALSLVSGVVYARLEHWDKQRIAFDLCSILCKAVGLVQSVTISAPVHIVFLCWVLAFCFCLFDFLSNISDNCFLTFGHDFTPPLPTAPACCTTRSRSVHCDEQRRSLRPAAYGGALRHGAGKLYCRQAA